MHGVSPTVTLPLGGPHEVVLTVADPTGVMASDTTQITVRDTSSLLLTLANSAVQVGPTTTTGAVVDVPVASGASAVDSCDPGAAVAHAAPAEFPIGIATVVNISAVDASANVVTLPFTVGVLTPAQATLAIRTTIQGRWGAWKQPELSTGSPLAS